MILFTATDLLTQMERYREHQTFFIDTSQLKQIEITQFFMVTSFSLKMTLDMSTSVKLYLAFTFHQQVHNQTAEIFIKY